MVRVAVRVGGEGGAPDCVVEVAHRLILAAVEFVEDHRPLALHLVRVDERAAHPVGLNLDGEREVLFREEFVVVRPVQPRRRVDLRADALEGVEDGRPLRLVEPLGPLEHEVFEEVRRARQPRRLIPAAHAIGHHKRHDGRGGLGKQQHLEAIRLQPVRLDPPRRFNKLKRLGNLDVRFLDLHK